jgi:hypothetical protein
MLMEPEDLARAGRPPGYDTVSAAIEAEKEQALEAFRRLSFERRLRERIDHQRPRRVLRSRLALVGALAIVLGIALLSHTSRRVGGVGLKTATVERALRNAPFFAGTPARASSADDDPCRVELAWSIERIVASVQRGRVKERDLQRLVEKVLAAAAGTGASPAGESWQEVNAADLTGRIERLRRERSIERLLAKFERVG